MFTCHPIRNGQTYLSEHLTANDYYAEGEEVTGTWLGKGAALLEIEGQTIGPKDDSFEALRMNRHPGTGHPLTRRDAHERIAFYDFQCSAPKSVSIAAVTLGDDRLVTAHRDAVAVAFRELETYAGRRNRSGDLANSRECKVTGNVIAAAFTHDASRELDAQLHTHLVCVNATFDEVDKQWFALDNGRMFQAVAFAGRIYQAELARTVRALGYEVREDRENGVLKGFEIEGVTAEDCRKQSTRRAQIEAEIERFRAEHGRSPSTAETHVISTETRERKLAEITTPEVRERQLAKYSADDRDRLEAVVAAAKARGAVGVAPLAAAELSAVVEGAAEHLLERKAVVTRRDVLTVALQENLGQVTVDELRRTLERHRDVLPLTTVDGSNPIDDVRVTSRAQLSRERASVEMIKAGIGQCQPLDRGEKISGLGADQEQALREVLASRDGTHALLGRAGAGKTHTLKEFDRCARRAGVVPLYAAPTHAAKEVLQDDGFEAATTCTQLLVDIRNGKASLAGRLLVVDEAGMLSTKQGDALLQAARRDGARVLLVGDEKQLMSVETGDWLGMLLRHSPLKSSVLTEIRRQKDEAYREAMKAMSQGRVADGLEKLAAEGWVHEGRGAYIERAASAWLQRNEEQTTAILVAPTWREIDRLNDTIRVELGRRGRLQGPEHRVEAMDIADLTAAQKRTVKAFETGLFVNPNFQVPGLRRGEWIAVVGSDRKTGTVEFANGAKVPVRRFGPMLTVARRLDLPIRAGDTLMLQGNDKKLGVINGERVTVLGVDEKGILIRQERGRKKGRELVLPPGYKTFVHGYAVTAEKSQGQTVEHAIVAAERLDGRRTYVATSRGRRTVEIHVPEKSPVLHAAKNTIDPQEAALDHKPVLPATPAQRGRLGTFIDRQRALLQRLAGHVRSRLTRLGGARGIHQGEQHEL